MNKDAACFDQRGDVKKKIDSKGKIKRVLVGELWIAQIGVNIGSEISKDAPFQRPVLVLASKIGGDLVYVVPLTSKYNENFSEYLIPFDDWHVYGLKEMSYFVINQTRAMSIKRLVKVFNNVVANNIHVPLVPDVLVDIVIDAHIQLLKNKKTTHRE